MNLLEFLISASFVVSFAFLISCVWKQIKEIHLFKSKSNLDKKYNNIITECDNTIISVSNGQTNGCEIQTDSKGVAEVQTTTNELEHLQHSDGNPIAVIRCERLQHINKTRPKRSNIRRSTRKSKVDSNVSFEQTYDKQNEHQFCIEEEISQKTSMFSQRIEEVTQPLTSVTNRTPDEEHESSQKLMRTNQQFIEMSQNQEITN